MSADIVKPLPLPAIAIAGQPMLKSDKAIPIGWFFFVMEVRPSVIDFKAERPTGQVGKFFRNQVNCLTTPMFTACNDESMVRRGFHTIIAFALLFWSSASPRAATYVDWDAARYRVLGTGATEADRRSDIGEIAQSFERLGYLEIDDTRRGEVGPLAADQIFVDPELTSIAFLKLNLGVEGSPIPPDQLVGFESDLALHGQTSSGIPYVIYFIDFEEGDAEAVARDIQATRETARAWFPSFFAQAYAQDRTDSCRPYSGHPTLGQPAITFFQDYKCSTSLGRVFKLMMGCGFTKKFWQGFGKGAGDNFRMIGSLFKPRKLFNDLKVASKELFGLVTHFQTVATSAVSGFCQLSPEQRADILCDVLGQFGGQAIAAAATGAGITGIFLGLKRLLTTGRIGAHMLILSKRTRRGLTAIRVGPLEVVHDATGTAQRLAVKTARRMVNDLPKPKRKFKFVQGPKDLWWHYRLHQREVRAYARAISVNPEFKHLFPNVRRRTIDDVAGVLHDYKKVTDKNTLTALYKFYGKDISKMTGDELAEFNRLRDSFNKPEYKTIEDYYRRRGLIDRHGNKLPEAEQMDHLIHVSDLYSRESVVSAEELGKWKPVGGERWAHHPEDPKILQWLRTSSDDILDHEGITQYSAQKVGVRVEEHLSRPVPAP